MRRHLIPQHNLRYALFGKKFVPSFLRLRRSVLTDSTKRRLSGLVSPFISALARRSVGGDEVITSILNLDQFYLCLLKY